MRSDNGFSLIEILVALFILSIISIGGTSVVLRMVSSKTAMEIRSVTMMDLARAHSRLRDDLAQWVPRNFESRPGLDPTSDFLGGGIGDGQMLFAFARDGRANPGLTENRSGLFAVRYRFEGDAIIRESRPFVDALYSTDTVEETLIEGASDVYVEFWQAPQWLPQWRSTPETGTSAPAAVRVTIEFGPDDSIVWLFQTPVELGS